MTRREANRSAGRPTSRPNRLVNRSADSTAGRSAETPVDTSDREADKPDRSAARYVCTSGQIYLRGNITEQPSKPTTEVDAQIRG